MTRRRWIADQVKDNRATLVGEHAAHLARVLRAQVGQEFDISTGSEVRRGRIVLVTEGRVEFELGDMVLAGAGSRITLALAIFKFDRMEWAIEKCTELGVARIVPFAARRSDAHLVTAAKKRVERWRRIAREASEQARRLTPPEIADPIKLRELLALPAQQRVVLSEMEAEVTLRDLCGAGVPSTGSGQAPARGSSLLLAVGPEGGWTNDELQALAKAGWKSAFLGSNILRAETAAIAAMAIVMDETSETISP